MTWVIVAGVLGVIISITAGLFLRCLFGQLAELRQQITGIDREMRAQRAHVTVLRHLLEEDEAGDNARPPQAAAVSGLGTGPPPAAQARPVRRKRHLELILGGAAAALVTVATVARDAIRGLRGQAVAAATGAVITATSVTMVTVQPWTDNSASGPPPSVPTATATYKPSGPPPTGPPSLPTGPPPGVIPSPSEPTTETAGPEPSASATPTGDASPAETRSPGPGRGPGDGPGTSAPGLNNQPTPPGTPATSGWPSDTPESGHGRGVTVGVTVTPLIEAGGCIVCG